MHIISAGSSIGNLRKGTTCLRQAGVLSACVPIIAVNSIVETPRFFRAIVNSTLVTIVAACHTIDAPQRFVAGVYGTEFPITAVEFLV